MGNFVGCDIVYLPRFKKMIEKSPSVLEKIFTPKERANTSLEHLAGIFAAKEATMKALGLQPGEWQNIEIQKKENGKPEVFVEDGQHVAVSISHDGDYAMAIVIAIID